MPEEKEFQTFCTYVTQYYTVITKRNDKIHNIHGFLFAFLHNIQQFHFFFFSVQGRKKCLCTISPYYFKPSKYRVIYFILNKFVSFKLQ